MAVPKKKVSRSRRNMRRFAGGNRLKKPTIVTCPSCNEPTRPHSVCKCGFYAGKSVLTVKAKEIPAAK
ncbi:MAG: 50S ribosomal protein L32 [Bdellovibrionota bacterium]|mgnify:CR=1 FL=1